LIAFSPDGQLGLLLTIMAIQLMALGDTPMGRFKRSWLMVITGLVFASLGVVSSIVPGLLTGIIQILLGVLNIVGGAALLLKQFLPALREIGTPTAVPVIVPPILKKLNFAQTVLNFLTIAFGLSMLIPGLVSGLIIAGILVINGLLLLILASLLQKLAAMQPGY
jgi:large-conductance mechanosensitive channel